MAKRTRNGIKVMPERLANTYPEKDRHGKIRWRFRKKGYPSAQLPGLPGEPEFVAAWIAATGYEPSSSNSTKVLVGSMRSLINDFCQDSMFTHGRTASTQTNYKGVYERFCASTGLSGRARGDMKYTKATPKILRKIIREKHSEAPTAARRLHSCLTLLFDYAVETDRVPSNPMKDVKRPKPQASKGHHTWTDEELIHYFNSYAPDSNERRAFCLILNSGLRSCNVFDLGWQHVKDGQLSVMASKGGGRVWSPIQSWLADSLEHSKGQMCFILSQKGTPYSLKGFQQWFSASCTSIGLKHCSAHGIRKSVSRIMAENNCTERQAMAVLSHKTTAMATHYSRDARQKLLTEQAFEKIKFPNLENSEKIG